MGSKLGVNVPPHARYPVAWYSPQVLWQSSRELLSSLDFQRNADRRELFPSTLEVIDLSQAQAADGNFNFDFVADTGDGGNATYTVASALLKNNLTVTDNHGQPLVLPEGRLLVLGGDLAYPGASPYDYQFRFTELFEAARDRNSPYAQKNDAGKVVVSIAQNHDWFDSLSSFNRTILRKYKILGYFHGQKNRQQQSYFALKLPHNWWVLGFDFALSNDLDGQQLACFSALIRNGQIKAGDRLILVYPKPYWVSGLGDGAMQGYPKRYQRLEHALHAAGAHLSVRIAGDLHHYARQSVASAAADAAQDLPAREQLITCGTGGAFLYPTHAKKVVADRAVNREPDLDAMDKHRQGRICIGRAQPGQGQSRNEACFPSHRQSRALAKKNLWAFFKWGTATEHALRWRLAQRLNSNFGFALLLGLIYWLSFYINSLVFTEALRPNGFKPMAELGVQEALGLWFYAMVFSPFGLLINALMIAGCALFGREDKLYGWVMGLLHGLVHGLAALVGYWFFSHALCNGFEQHTLSLANCAAPAALGATVLKGVLTGALMVVWGTAFGGLIFGLYLWLMAKRGCIPNNSYGSLAVQDYKGFMRLKITPDGSLQARFLGIEKVPRRWQRHPDPQHRPLWTPHPSQPPVVWAIRDEFEIKGGSHRADAC